MSALEMALGEAGPTQERYGGLSWAGPKKVLVAEDSRTIRCYLRRTLTAELGDCPITEVGDGASALAELRQGGFDFLITDIKMPVMDGTELLRLASQEGLLKGKGVLVLSSSITSRLESSYGGGNVVFLRKPAVHKDIYNALERILFTLSGRAKNSQAGAA